MSGALADLQNAADLSRRAGRRHHSFRVAGLARDRAGGGLCPPIPALSAGSRPAQSAAGAAVQLAPGAHILSATIDARQAGAACPDAVWREVDIIDLASGKLTAQVKDGRSREAAALPARLRDEMARQARSAFPRECCGLIEGLGEDGAFRATRCIRRTIWPQQPTDLRSILRIISPLRERRGRVATI